uniref:Septin-type G domain-containing protein n=1 Tax=Maylandia zebra TaxID=106582 RepID=A0A3P9DN75_9CICH
PNWKLVPQKRGLKPEGPPAVYQLRAKKQNIGTLTKVTVGEKNLYKTNKTILLVSETGAGKSTLINALLNYTMGVKWEDKVWFEIVEDERRSQSESQTSDVIVYEIFGFEGKTLPYSLTIIDTPGYGGTKGIERDVIISQRLFDLFSSDDGVHEISAVGLVVKASVNRLSQRLMYIYDSVMSLFGKNMEKKIVAMITHSDGSRPKDVLLTLEAANIKCAKNEKNQPVYFLFDNQQHEERLEEKTFFKHSWELTQKNINHFTDFLEKSSPQTLMTTVEVLKERIRLTACIQNLQERIKLAELKQTQIRQIQEALKKLEAEMKRNERFTVEVHEVYKAKEPIDGGLRLFLFYEAAVCCTVCEENCHYPGCTMGWIPEHCEVMKGGRCTVCSRKCLASDHVKEKWRYVIKTRRVMKTNEEMKKQYEKNKMESKKMLSLLESLGMEMNQLIVEKSKFLDESYQHVIRLEQIALKADSASTIVHLDFLSEKMKEKRDTEKVQKLEEMRSRVDEGTREAYWYKLAERSSAIKNIGRSFPWHK